MNKDADVIKILTQLGLQQEVELTDTQEKMLQAALDNDEQYFQEIEKLFSNPLLTKSPI